MSRIGGDGQTDGRFRFTELRIVAGTSSWIWTVGMCFPRMNKTGAKVIRCQTPFWTPLPLDRHTAGVLFMVIERFKSSDPAPVGERFARQGRMLPDGVSYGGSWLEPDGSRCFQVMDAPDRATLDSWIARWSDLVEFEVVPVVTSSEFWEQR